MYIRHRPCQISVHRLHYMQQTAAPPFAAYSTAQSHFFGVSRRPAIALILILYSDTGETIMDFFLCCWTIELESGIDKKFDCVSQVSDIGDNRDGKPLRRKWSVSSELESTPLTLLRAVPGKNKRISEKPMDTHDPRKKPSAPFVIDLSIACLRLASERIRRMAAMEFSVY